MRDLDEPYCSEDTDSIVDLVIVPAGSMNWSWEAMLIGNPL